MYDVTSKRRKTVGHTAIAAQEKYGKAGQEQCLQLRKGLRADVRGTVA